MAGHEHHHEVNPKTIKYLMISFIINLLLSVVEIVAGIYSRSAALIGDALHNTSDAISILIAVLAYKIGKKKANTQYTYGFKRAEIIGGFVNLILLFISGGYLIIEGISRIITPEEISGRLIIYVSILALIIDIATAKLSHHEAGHNSNIRMVFLHNLADALGSVGVIISGLFVVFLGWNFVDGIVAIMIAIYMLYQSVLSFPKFINILMNAAPENIKINDIKTALLEIDGICDVHHIHLWQINEHDVSLECHIVGQNIDLIKKAAQVLNENFEIEHCNIQLETQAECCKCEL